MADTQYVFTPGGMQEQFALIKQDLATKASNVLEGYEKPQATSAITSTDTVEEAIGKLEKALDGLRITVDTQVSGTSENPVQNKAIYAFVNSSVSTNTANFIGTFNSVAELEAYSGTVTNNDYAFVISTDSAGNTVYNRYKYNGSAWAFEYALNNSSFTATQWATIQSGLTSADKTQIGTNTSDISTLQQQMGAVNTTLEGVL